LGRENVLTFRNSPELGRARTQQMETITSDYIIHADLRRVVCAREVAAGTLSFSLQIVIAVRPECASRHAPMGKSSKSEFPL